MNIYKKYYELTHVFIFSNNIYSSIISYISYFFDIDDMNSCLESLWYLENKKAKCNSRL